MRLSFARVRLFISLFLMALGLLAAYQLELADLNDYLGYRLFPVDLPYLAAATAGVFFTCFLMPARIAKPSDFFALFYGLFVLFPYATLHPMGGPVEPAEFVLRFMVLAFPAVAVRVLAFSVPPLRLPGVISLQAMVWLLAAFCSIGLAVSLASAPGSAGFDLISSHERRLEGRDVFVGGTLMAYASTMTVNGFAPFLAFVAGWRHRAGLLAFALGCALSYYFLLGLKAPLLYALLAAAVGHAVRANRLHQVGGVVLGCLLGIFAVFMIEHVLFDYSYAGDYFIRRALSVPPHLITGYFDLIDSPPGMFWTPWTPSQGIGLDGGNITFIVGEWMFPMWGGTNANTNTFVQQLAAGGIPLYFATIMLVACVFSGLDSVFASKGNPVLLYVGFSYAILLPEQMATTALLSSGVGALVALGVFTRSGQTVSQTRSPPPCKPASAA